MKELSYLFDVETCKAQLADIVDSVYANHPTELKLKLDADCTSVPEIEVSFKMNTYNEIYKARKGSSEEEPKEEEKCLLQRKSE